MPLPLADISFGELLLVALEVFFFVIWIWILITILTDLFRDHEISGWAKAAWVPVPGLHPVPDRADLPDRPRQRHARPDDQSPGRREKALRRIRPRAGPRGSPADELHKLNELKEKGAPQPEEFDQAKAKLLA